MKTQRTLKVIRLRRRIVKRGDVRELYVPGQKLILKWGKEWNIGHVIYNPIKNETSVNLFM